MVFPDAMIKTTAALDVEERRKRALEIAGRYASGMRDISREHDKHLADAVGK